MSGPAPPARCLVLAKAPVPGRVKTRLGRQVGMPAAAVLASASLRDTLDTCTTAFGAERCHLALAGDLAQAVDGARIGAQLAGWTVHPQRGTGLAARLAHAHAALGPGPVVQVGMDTPQLTCDLLDAVADGLVDHDAVLGPAPDGGWWVLALRDPAGAAVLRGVPMSTPRTCTLTRTALERAGLRVGSAPPVRDVDTAADADAVSALAPHGRFARAWARVREPAA